MSRDRNPTADPMVKRLLSEIAAYEKETERRWTQAGKRIIERYMDARDRNDATRKLNILWSNVETLKPFLYSATPKPVVSTRHDDASEIARVAAEVLERALAYTLKENHFGTALRNARDDYLLPGRGTAWVRYKPQIIPQQAQVSEQTGAEQSAQLAVQTGTDEDGAPEVQEVVGWEQTISDYVNWRDFGHNVCATWEEVDIVWRIVPMDRDALIERFGEEIGGKVPLDYRAPDGSTAKADDGCARAGVYECWWKSKRKAIWIVKTHPEPLDALDDPLGLDEFFPCPRPIYATLSTESLIPTPDYAQYQDQASQIDDLTGRIGALTKAIKAAGVYDGNVEALKTLLQEGHDNVLIPVENWAALAEKGGIITAIQLLPMKEIVQTLLALHDARDKQKADLYEVSGMSDIIRGNTNPEETATAQNIKANFASKRLSERQAEVARFAANLVSIMGNVIALHFSIETLRAMTGMRLLTRQEKEMATAAFAQQQMAGQMPPAAPGAPVPPPAAAPQPVPPQMGHNGGPALDDDIAEAMKKPTWEDVIELLHDNPQRRFSIDIETDSLVAPGDAAEQAARTAFLQAVGQFLQQAIQAVQQVPEMAPLIGKMLMFAVRGFRVGRDLDDAFEEFVQQLEEKSKNPPPQRPDPAMAKVQGELQLQQQAQAFEQEQARAKQAQEAAEAQHRQRMELADARHRQRMEIMQADQTAAGAHADRQADAGQAHVDAAVERMKAEFQQQTSILVARINALAKIQAAAEAKDATPNPQAAEHQEEQGA